jgi:NADH:ubiquinone reductase (non-electrogenic)
MAAVSTMKPLVSATAMRQIRFASRRSFATSLSSLTPRPRGAPRTIFHQVQLKAALRRSYANDAASKQLNAKPKKRRFRFFRWTWRFIWLGSLAGIAYLAYDTYQMRTPADQPPPDPSKKTLVILGKSTVLSPCLRETANCRLTRCRYRLGFRVSVKET